MQEFLSIGIIGAMLSFGVEWVQAKWGTSSLETKAISIIGSIVLGVLVWALSFNVAIYEAVLGILASASTVYAMFFSGKAKQHD